MQQAQHLAEEYRLAPDNQNLDHIPGDHGLPYLGRSLDFIFHLEQMAKRHYREYGEVSRVFALNKQWLMVLGADNWQTILLDHEHNFSCEMGYESSLGDFYAGGLLLRDFDEHKIQRRILQVAFKTDAMKGYVTRINPILQGHVESFARDSRFLFGPHIKETLLDVGARIFIGIDDSNELGQGINQAFVDINRGLVAVVKAELPGTNFWRAKRGMRVLHKFFGGEIADRRSGDRADMFSAMCRATMEDGSHFPDEDILAHAAFLLFAAHDTTTSLLNSIVLYTSMHPHWQEKMRREVCDLGVDALSYEHLPQLETIDRVIHECMRLIPPAPIGTRRTVRECELGGYTIPAHTKILIPFTFNHRDPRYWSDPESFDPDRFSPERQEQKHHPFCFHPFGGGSHKCIGMHFANMVVKTFLFHFLRSYRYGTPAGYQPRLQWAPLPKPTRLPLKLEAIR